MKPSTYRRIATARPAFVGSIIKTVFRVKRRVVNTRYGAFLIDPFSNLGFTLLEHGEYEPEVTKAINHFLPSGGIFIDAGANEGYHTVTASSIASRVIAIEPQSRALVILRENIRANNCLNIDVLPVAISDQDGSANIYLYPSTNTGASSLIPQLRYPVPSERIQTMTLARVFAERSIHRCDLIKIDIEGFEYEAIMGSVSLFQSHQIKSLVIEPSERQLAKRGHSFEQIASFLRSCGYAPDESFQCDSYRQVWVC